MVLDSWNLPCGGNGAGLGGRQLIDKKRNTKKTPTVIENNCGYYVGGWQVRGRRDTS